MKKLTALLLGTVIGIAFTASDAFAENPVMKYLKSDDGRTGGYLGLSYINGPIDDVKASYLRGSTKSTWALDDGEGAQVQFGFDFGKIRFDWRVAALYSNVASIDGAVKDFDASDDAVVAYSTINFDLDLYRFELMKQNFVNIAVTPYVGAGIGYGGGWMTGKKNSDALGADAKRDAGGHGHVYSIGGGALINLTSFAGITVGYTHLEQTFDREKVRTHISEVGLRLTF